MNPEFEQHVRSCIPDESIYLHFGRKITTGRMEQNTSAMELEDGSLVTVVSAGRSVSTDGGDTWTEPDPVSDGAGNRLDVGFRGLVRLKSGRMGGFEAQSGHGALFRSSDDDGKSWSEPTRVGRRYNIRTGEPNDLAYMHSPGIVTSDGRLVAAVFVMLGHHIPRERGRAFWGDDVVLVGHHGYEQCLCMVWVYHSDDEGKTWQAERGDRHLQEWRRAIHHAGYQRRRPLLLRGALDCGGKPRQPAAFPQDAGRPPLPVLVQ